MEKKEERKPQTWDITDPKPPVIRSGPTAERHSR